MQKSVKEDRQKWIGGSDIPIIMGISPFTTRFDLLLYKAGLQENEFEGNEYTEYGNNMEPKIRTYINGLYNTNFEEGKHENKTKGFRCHTDGENEDTILEIKTTSQFHDNVDDYKVYLVQLLFYMMNTGKNKGWLAVYKRPEDFNEEFDVQRLLIYQIDIEDYMGLCNEIMEAVERFMIDLERVKENPLITEEELMPIAVQNISKEIINLEEQIAQYKELSKQYEDLKKQLYEAMNENNIKKWKAPNGTLFTIVPSTPDKVEMVFNEEKFKEEQPVVYASYTEEKTKKGKSGYIRITTP